MFAALLLMAAGCGSGDGKSTAPVTDLAGLGDALYVLHANDHDIERIALDGSAPSHVVTLTATPTGIAAHGGKLLVSTDAGEILELSSDGKSKHVLASRLGAITRPAADARFVYWVDIDEGTILRAPLSGGDSSSVVSGLDDVAQLALCGDQLLVAGSYVLMHASTTGGGADGLATAAGAPVLSVAANAHDAYFTSYDSVWRVPCAGGDASVVEQGLSEPDALTVLGSDVYVATHDGILRLSDHEVIER